MSQNIENENELRTTYVSLEKPYLEVVELMPDIKMFILAKHQNISRLISGIDKMLNAFGESYYLAEVSLKGSAFERFIQKWGDTEISPVPVTAEDLRGLEKAFSPKCKLPPAYKTAVKKHGLPTLVPELSNRVKDLMGNYPTIGRFYSPQEMKELSEAIRAADKKVIRCEIFEYDEDPEEEYFSVDEDSFVDKNTMEDMEAHLEEGAKELIAFASDGAGRHLCYTHTQTHCADEPSASGEPDAIYDEKTLEIKGISVADSFKDWFDYYTEIRKLNISEENYQDLQQYLDALSELIKELENEPEYIDNSRYHSSFLALIEGIGAWQKIYNF